MAKPPGGVDGRDAAVVDEAVRRGGRLGRPRTPRTAKDDGQPGLPRTTDSWGRYPLQDLGQTVVSIVSAARGLRPK